MKTPAPQGTLTLLRRSERAEMSTKIASLRYLFTFHEPIARPQQPCGSDDRWRALANTTPDFVVDCGSIALDPTPPSHCGVVGRIEPNDHFGALAGFLRR